MACLPFFSISNHLDKLSIYFTLNSVASLMPVSIRCLYW